MRGLEPIFTTWHPAAATCAHAGPRQGGWYASRAGCIAANGAGHFVKMVHNGIEYGVMAAYAEGMAVPRRQYRQALRQGRCRDHAAARSRHYQRSQFARHCRTVAARQSHWLMAARLQPRAGRDPNLASSPAGVRFRRRPLDDQGAIDEGVPAHVLSRRFMSGSARAARRISPTRCCRHAYEFGGHIEKPAGHHKSSLRGVREGRCPRSGRRGNEHRD